MAQGGGTPGKERRFREYGLTSGTLGTTAGQTLMVVLLPVLLSQHTTSTTLIGLVIAGEGLFALLVPYPIGMLSDRMPASITRRFGRRNSLLLLIAPLLAIALVTVPFLDGFLAIAAAAFVFFALLHAFRTPLFALMIDSVPEQRWGRVEGVRGALHAGGLGYALVGGGLLFALWPPLPFMIAAVLIVLTAIATFVATPRSSNEYAVAPDDEARAATTGGTATDESTKLFATVRDRPDVRWYLTAHALWTGAVDGIRPFIFLFGTVVLGISIAESSLVLLVLLLGLAIGSVIIGRLGDRFGRERVLTAAALVMGTIMACGVFIRTVPVAIVLLVPVGVAAAAFISLPYPLFASFIGEDRIGRDTGIYSIATGVAHLCAPIIVGAALDLGRPLFPEYQGLPLMWPIVGAFALLSVPALRMSLRHSER